MLTDEGAIDANDATDAEDDDDDFNGASNAKTEEDDVTSRRQLMPKPMVISNPFPVPPPIS